MLGIFKNIFKSDSGTTFFALYNNIVKWRESKVYPFSYNLPTSISFPEDFWKNVIGIYKDTTKDGLERAISVFYVDKELILTSVVKGTEKNVQSNHRVSARYIPHPTRKGYFRKEVMVDGKVVKKRDVYFKNAPKKISLEYLFNMHTHPPHTMEGMNRYGFFSVQDINLLLSSEAILTGLVTDRLWILIRTSETPNVSNLEQKDITVENLKDVLKLGVYTGEFKKKVENR